MFARRTRRFSPLEFVAQLQGDVPLDQPASIQRHVPLMDQCELHILIADSESHDQVEFTGRRTLAPFRSVSDRIPTAGFPRSVGAGVACCLFVGLTSSRRRVYERECIKRL